MTKINSLKGAVRGIIEQMKGGTEWLDEMESLVDELREATPSGCDVEVDTGRLQGSHIQVSITAEFTGVDRFAMEVMDDYKWDTCSFKQNGTKYVLFLKRRYSY